MVNPIAARAEKKAVEGREEEAKQVKPPRYYSTCIVMDPVGYAWLDEMAENSYKTGAIHRG